MGFVHLTPLRQLGKSQPLAAVSGSDPAGPASSELLWTPVEAMVLSALQGSNTSFAGLAEMTGHQPPSTRDSPSSAGQLYRGLRWLPAPVNAPSPLSLPDEIHPGLPAGEAGV